MKSAADGALSQPSPVDSMDTMVRGSLTFPVARAALSCGTPPPSPMKEQTGMTLPLFAAASLLYC